MIRLAISVEGQTEEAFVKTVLAEHLREAGVEPTPILIGKARARDSSKSGGGNVSLERLASELAFLYGSFDAVTSLVDFYGFRERKGEETIDGLENRLCRRIRDKVTGDSDPRRIIPYVQQYEFEGLLFSNVDAFGVIGASAESLQALRNIRGQFQTPEDINDHPDTVPSKRIAKVMLKYGTRGYSKVAHGPLIAEETGVDVIRRECPRFYDWVRRLEALEGLE